MVRPALIPGEAWSPREATQPGQDLFGDPAFTQMNTDVERYPVEEFNKGHMNVTVPAPPLRRLTLGGSGLRINLNLLLGFRGTQGTYVEGHLLKSGDAYRGEITYTIFDPMATTISTHCP